MSIQVLIAIAQICSYSVAPSTISWHEAYNNRVSQLVCQKQLISCVKRKKRLLEFDILADCVMEME